jgi:hypothetical protein
MWRRALRILLIGICTFIACTLFNHFVYFRGQVPDWPLSARLELAAYFAVYETLVLWPIASCVYLAFSIGRFGF